MRTFKFFLKPGNGSLKLNALSNLFGSGWSALLNLVAVPIYLHYLGVESYGIIGIFYTIQAITALLDFGVSIIISRELARLSANPDDAQEMRDITSSTEAVTWVIGFLIGLFLFALSPIIAKYWLQGENLSVTTVSQALMIMSVGFVAQWAINFYTNGLIGLERQYLLNSINSICITTRVVGGILVVAFASSTIQALLIWQAATSALQAFVMALALRKCLPFTSMRGRFRWHLLREKRRFAAGITTMGILGLILYQLDKVILSKLLSLEYFGYYILASTIVNSGLALIPKGVASAVYPRFSSLVSLNDQTGLRELYHRSTQMIAVLMLPAATLLIVFPYEIIKLWTQKAVTAENSWVLVTILAIGTSINGFLTIPYYLQMANGWTRIIINSSLIAICVVVPTLIITASYYGAVGGAASWLLLNVIALLTNVRQMHKKILIGEQWRWYFVDIAAPFAVALIVAFCGKLFLAIDTSQLETFVVISLTGLATYALTALSLKSVRGLIWSFYKSYV
jgi:O-antigen/teichoic acid export membrane protein